MLQKILAFSIEQRWVVVVITLGAAAFGVAALSRLPIDAVPDITNNQVQINCTAPSLSPEQIELQVTYPLEVALAGIPGLDHTRSLSRNGFCQITAVFDDEVDVYFARQQISERLGEAERSLPPGAEVSLGPISTGLGEVFMYAVEYAHPDGEGADPVPGRPGWQPDGAYLTPRGDRLTTAVQRAAFLREVQDWIIRPQLRKVRGLAGVDSIGGYVKQYHVAPDPTLLVRHGVTLRDLLEALERNNVAAGAGVVERQGEAYVVRSTGWFDGVESIGAVALRSRDGTPVRVRDVADVTFGEEQRSGSAGKDGQEVVIGTAMMLIGDNSRTVAKAAGERVREIARSLPPDVVVTPLLDRTVLVDATIETVRANLFEGAVLVIVVLFLLLGNLRAAFIAAAAIPLSMLLASIGMVKAGISGNLMSLGAIDFGIIVDGSVIIVENCLRRLAMKQRELGRLLSLRERLDTVRDASQEVRQATAFGEIIIICVYVPILALTGVEGKMFHPMAMTVILALTAAFLLSLTFVPAAVAILVRGRVKEKENVVMRGAGRLYRPVLAGAIRHRVLVALAAFLLFGGSLLLFRDLGQEFVPKLDEGDIAMQAVRLPSTGIDQSTALQLELERAITALPEVRVVFSKTGTAEMASDPMTPNLSDTFIMLHPLQEWPDPSLSKDELIARIDAVVTEHPGHGFEFTQPIELRFNELISGVRSDVAVKVFGDDFPTMERTAGRIAEILRDVPGARDVQVEQTSGLPNLFVTVDREAIARYGLSVADVQDVVATAVGGRHVGQIFEGDRRFELVVRLPQSRRERLDELGAIPVPLPRAVDEEGVRHHVPLASVARIERRLGVNQFSRENGKRRVAVVCNVRGRDLGGFVATARSAVERRLARPAGTWLEWGGQFKNLTAARERLSVVVPLCFLLILGLLFMTLGSVKHGLLVFTGVPLALTGGVASLWLRGMPFSISAAVGFIALSGVAVLNGLVMITFINRLRHDGESLDAALRIGCAARLRPVLMTALVASLGFLPMALASGRGAEVQRPLATVVVGGIVTSTLLTLLVLPALYRLVHRRAAWEAR